jgi:hypothetical protein
MVKRVKSPPNHFGSRGREFESLRPSQLNLLILKAMLTIPGSAAHPFGILRSVLAIAEGRPFMNRLLSSAVGFTNLRSGACEAYFLPLGAARDP